MTKRTLCFILAFLMALTLCVPAFADEGAAEAEPVEETTPPG